MNAAAFFILGALIVAGALAAVGTPRTREAAAALLAVTTANGILAMASGAYLTGAVEIALPALAIAGTGAALRRGGYLDMAAGGGMPVGSILIGASAAAGLVVILLVAFVGNSSDWHAGSGGGALLTLLHYRAPFALVGGLLTLIVGVAGGLLVGRRGSDERDYDRTHEARHLREERTRRRREDREAARRRRRAPAEGGS